MAKLHGSGKLEIGRMVLSVFPSNIREVSQLEHYWLGPPAPGRKVFT